MQQTTSSFTNFRERNQSNQRNRGTNTNVGISDGRKKYYMDLCMKKGITPQNVSAMNNEQFEEALKVVREFYPASKIQKDKIKSLSEELGITEIKMKSGETYKIDENFLNRLRGGRDGSASKILQHLFNIEREQRKDLAPTEGQLKWLVDMFLCPDVNYDDIGVPTAIKLDSVIDVTTNLYFTDPLGEDYSSFVKHNKEVITQKEWFGEQRYVNKERCFGHIEVKINEKQLHRRITYAEFQQHVNENVKREQASSFIEKYKHKFYEWKNTRITEKQENMIRTLEKRFANLYTPKPVQESSRIIDKQLVIDYEMADQDKSNYEVSSYTPLDSASLAMLSVEEATELIARMQWELQAKERYSFGEKEDASETLEEIRTAKNQNEKRVEEFTALNDLIHGLYATIGLQADEDVLSTARAVAESFKTENGFQLQLIEEKYLKRLQEFFYMLIDEGEFTEMGLMGMLDESGSETATRILMGRF